MMLTRGASRGWVGLSRQLRGASPSPAIPRGYRPNVGLMLISADRRIFVGRRAGMPEGMAWQMPQGGIDEGEEPYPAALRERCCRWRSRPWRWAGTRRAPSG